MSNFSFKPAWWLPGPHLQTLWSALCRQPIKSLSLRRERFELPDGDFVDLDWVGAGNGPVVLILHGLEGSIASPYAQGMLHAIQQQGWRGVFMHFRGCSEEPNRLPRMYHSGETKDVANVIQGIKEREPHIKLAAVGFSMGGNVLLKWLGETGQQNPLTAAIAVSVPFELHKASERLQRGFSRIYHLHLLKCLQKKAAMKFQLHSMPRVLSKINSLRTIHDFDDKVTAPLHGFIDAKDYYTQCSSRQYLKKIRVPTLLLQAKDDPFMTADIIPEQRELSERITLEVTEKGGHVGFVTGSFPWNARYWVEERAPAFFHQYL